MSIERTGSCPKIQCVTASESLVGAYLVPVEGKEELQRVLIENLYGRIEQGDGEEFAVWTVTDRQHVVSHLERSGVD